MHTSNQTTVHMHQPTRRDHSQQFHLLRAEVDRGSSVVSDYCAAGSHVEYITTAPVSPATLTMTFVVPGNRGRDASSVPQTVTITTSKPKRLDVCISFEWNNRWLFPCTAMFSSTQRQQTVWGLWFLENETEWELPVADVCSVDNQTI